MFEYWRYHHQPAGQVTMRFVRHHRFPVGIKTTGNPHTTSDVHFISVLYWLSERGCPGGEVCLRRHTAENDAWRAKNGLPPREPYDDEDDRRPLPAGFGLPTTPSPLKPLGIAAAIQAVLLGLRMSGLVSWPWWLILAPAAIVAASVAALGAVLLALGEWGRS